MNVRVIYKWLGYFIVPLIGAIFTYFVAQNAKNKEQETRDLRFEKIHTRAVNEFSNSIYRFAGLVSGMRSYMNNSENLPNASQFQRFVKDQFKGLNSNDRIVVSFIDSTHVFKHNFTRDEMDPEGLVNRGVSTLRSEEKIAQLDQLMEQDDLLLFPPLNLIEGWVGIPLNFRVHREGKTLGYVAPIIDFKTIMEDLYNDPASDEFVFHFVTAEGHDIDRYKVHNGTKVFNESEDPKYYKNYVKDGSIIQYKEVEYFGYKMKIGMTSKAKIETSSVSDLIWIGYAMFSLFVIVISSQMLRARRLNEALEVKNNLINARQEEIDSQNKSLIKLNATKDKFFSIIGHDLKQPFNAIKGLLYLLKEEEVSDPGLQKIVEELDDSTTNTMDLLSNLLRWAMSQTGEIKYVPKRINFNEEIETVLKSLQHHASQKNITIIKSLSEDMTVNADSDMIKTILRNIVSNAIKFSHPNGAIHISVERIENYVKIAVKDDGVGMDTSKIDVLFSLENKVSVEGTLGEKGTGLGLLLCKEFVDKHNGTIEITSEKGKGALVVIKLPQG